MTCAPGPRTESSSHSVGAHPDRGAGVSSSSAASRSLSPIEELRQVLSTTKTDRELDDYLFKGIKPSC